MKIFKLIGLIVALMFLIGMAGLVLAEQPKATNDGEFNPHSFATWKTIEGNYNAELDLVFQRILNPDPEAEVKEIILGIFPITVSSGKIIEYSFKRNGVKYLFRLDLTENHYKQILPELKKV